MEIPLSHYLITSLFILCIGFLIVISKNNIIAILIGIEMMFNSGIMNFVVYSNYYQDIHGQILVLFILCITVSETILALVIMIKVFNHYNTIDMKNNELIQDI